MRVLDLFGGAGGVALGLDAAGCDHVSVEWHEPAAAVARAAGHRVAVGDVRDHDMLRGAVAELGGCDLVWASPPCQAWSTAGRRLGAQDERNGWPWTWDALDAIGHPPLVAENVPGMLHHSADGCGDPDTCAGCYFAAVLLPALRERYAHVEYRSIDAADLGVPQHRIRVIVQARHDAIRWPALTHDDPGSWMVAAGAREPWVGAEDATGAPVVGGGSRGHGVDEWRPRTASDAPAPCVTGYGSTGALYRPPPPTVTATEGRGCATDQRRASRAFGRRLTVEECAVLQAFPADYPWTVAGTVEEQYRAVGNAVPPPVAAALVGVYRCA